MSKKLRLLLVTFCSAAAILCLGALAACGDGSSGSSGNPPSAVSASSITYDGSTISWSSPGGTVSYYSLAINDDTKTAYSTSCAYIATEGTTAYNITITAVNEYGSSTAVTQVFYPLATISVDDLTFTAEGVMSWSAVENASGYLVEVNGTAYETPTTTFSGFVYGTMNNIRVKAVGANSQFFSGWSNTVSKFYYAAPSNIDYDGQYITWSGVGSNAATYAVYINNALYESGISGTKLAFDSNGATFDVKLQTEGNGSSYFSSQLSDSYKFLYLGTATNLRINDDGQLTWDAVEGATGYDVEVTGSGATTTKTVTENVYSLAAGQTWSVRVKPIVASSSTEENTKYFASYSAQSTYTLLTAPTLQWYETMSLTDGQEARALYWNAVTGDVGGYNIKVVYTNTSGSQTTNVYATQATLPSFSYAYTAVGTYEISVQTVATVGTSSSNSTYSDPLTVVRLPAPNAASSNFVTSTANDLAQGFTVNYTAVSGAASYRLIKDGAETTYSSTTTSLTVGSVTTEDTTTTQTIQYAIQSVGSIKTVGGLKTVTLSSLTANSLAVTITVLATPQNIDITDGTIMWNAVSGAHGYAIDTGTGYETSTTYFSLSDNLMSVGDYSVKVCAKGDGAQVLASNYSEVYTVRKLSAPYNIRISTGTNEGSLSWDGPTEYAKSFNIYFNGANEPVPNTQIDNVNSDITPAGISIVMVSVANYWNDLGTVYYLSSEKSQTYEFVKLQSPSFASPAFTGNTLNWSAPANVTQAANITYWVYMDGYLLNGVQDGTSMDLSSIMEAGTHTLSIKAIGDGSNYVNSDISATISITKLETPDVSRTETAYSWSGVSGASGYQVYIGDELVGSQTHDYRSTYTYTPQFASVTTYTVKVYAIGDNGASTINSSPCTITQSISKISAPSSVSATYSHDNFTTEGYFTITTAESAHAAGYLYTVNGVSSDVKDGLTYTFSTPSAGAYVVSVRAAGGLFDEDGVYWYTSDATSNATYTILSAPSQGTINKSNDGYISWTATGSNSYTVIVSYSDGTTETVTVTAAKYTYESGKTPVSVKICTNGNGVTTFSSAYVEKYFS